MLAMVDRARFTDVTIQYIDWAGDSRIGKAFAKVIGPIGGDLRLVRGIRPVATGPANGKA